MKKLTFVALAVSLLGAAWWNRYPLMFLLFSQYPRRPPQEIHFSQTKSGRVVVSYVPGKYLSSRANTIAQRLSNNLKAAETELGVQLDSDLQVYLYNNWEEKGYAVRNISVAHADLKHNSIHCIVNDHLDGTRERLEYLLLLQKKLGNPAKPEWGEYCAAALSGVWNEKQLTEWAHFLLERSLPPEFPDFFSSYSSRSDFLICPWNSLFARFIKEKYGWNEFAELYRSFKLPANYQSGWANYVAQLSSGDPLPLYVFHPQFQKGMSYAYANGYDSGYATEKSVQSLEELKQLGVTWIAAIPYGFMRSHSATEIHYSGHDIFGESDESMLAAVLQAHALGMKVMMKPQLWMHYETWPGNVAFETDAQWDEWFESYENWILHYAILAELIHADLLCVGTELSQTTLKKPERWRSIIQKIRKVYHGPLVYASNWGKEFEEISFWDALDYIGLDNYYPVRTKLSDGPAEMKAAFQQQRLKIKAVSDRYRKPVLFTEIGYHSTDGAGMGTQEDDYGGYNEQAQADCYRLALETYWNEPWFSGMYWWKWFSDPTDEGRDADQHSPHGRAAQKVIFDWYKKQK